MKCPLNHGGNMKYKPNEKYKDYINECTAIFDLSFLSKPRSPIAIQSAHLRLSGMRVNHYMIKSNDELTLNFGEITRSDRCELEKLISPSLAAVGAFNISDRYCYLTMDCGWVNPGYTQRVPGWHIDGMQGDEVEVKVPCDYTFTWCSALPTIYSPQGFSTEGIDVSKDNIFEHLGKQVSIQQESLAYMLYASNSYSVHKCMLAKEPVFRDFVRLSFTYVPITSVKMTINPSMNYNYPIHTTKGEFIPK